MMVYITIIIDKDRWDVVFQDSTTKQYIVYPVVVLAGSPVFLASGTSPRSGHNGSISSDSSTRSHLSRSQVGR